MNITVKNSGKQFKTWQYGDDGFYFSPDDITLVARAGFEISQTCPREYRMIIAECINNGWIKPVAYQPVHEHFMEELAQ